MRIAQSHRPHIAVQVNEGKVVAHFIRAISFVDLTAKSKLTVVVMSKALDIFVSEKNAVVIGAREVLIATLRRGADASNEEEKDEMGYPHRVSCSSAAVSGETSRKEEEQGGKWKREKNPKKGWNGGSRTDFNLFSFFKARLSILKRTF